MSQVSHRQLSELLHEGLGLKYPPVAVSIVNEPPAGVASNAGRHPSTCSFWRLAEREVFYAPAAAHNGCAVGAHVMGFPLSKDMSQELMAAVTLMAEVNYLPKSEVADIPRVASPGAGIVYGPLADTPVTPTAVIVWVTPAQAMILGEALQTTAWTQPDGDASAVFGRPACGAIARAVNTQRVSFSLGCAGMRTYTGIEPTLSPLVIPASLLDELEAELPRVLSANERMLEHYRAQKASYV